MVIQHQATQEEAGIKIIAFSCPYVPLHSFVMISRPVVGTFAIQTTQHARGAENTALVRLFVVADSQIPINRYTLAIEGLLAEIESRLCGTKNEG